MKRMLVGLLSALACLGAAAAENAPRERASFNAGWKFFKGDDPEVGGSLDYERVKDAMLPTGDHLLNYAPPRATPLPTKLGWWLTFPKPDFDDSAWRTLNLPHDWGIEGPFMQELPGSTGKLPWAGTGWYRKKFTLPAEDAGRRVTLEFDGAMAYALVWCNGQLAGGWAYGYSSWRVDLTRFLKPGAENVIAVRLNTPRESSRWYPGAGIYRNVWLTKTNDVAVAHWGVFVTTPQVSAEAALVNVGITLDNKTAADAAVQASVRLFAADANGQPVGEPVAVSEPQAVNVSAGRQAHAAHTLHVATPKLWSLRERNRYVAETRVMRDGRAIDVVRMPFGIRTLSVSATEGFKLNGERVPIRGVCMHHDLGALGAAVNTRALERQLEILQSFGCNAIRTSHNPPAPELLELADRMGFLVMVELSDAWQNGKKADDYSRLFDDWHERDLRALLRRDRNHPSVIQWSIGNELPDLGAADGWKVGAHLAAIVREEDRTRVVVVGSDKPPAAYQGFESVLDVIGFNYKPAEYAKLHARHPHVVMMGSETASTISSRGEYFFPVSDKKSDGAANFQVSSYDLYAPWWAWPPDVEWKALDENPYVLGEFVWTGFDYLGEPTPFDSDATNLLNFADPAARAKAAQELAALGKIRVPSRSSYFGIVDLAGFPKDRYYLYQARWRPDLPMAHILPHWNWSERVGEVTPVHVYSSGDEAELFLNGQSLGRKKRGALEYRFRWDDVKYQPGELKVVTYKHGRPWAEAVQRTTGAPAALRVTVDRAELRADGSDLAFVTVAVVDKDGLVVPRSKPLLKFSVSGAAELVATDNGDPTDHRVFASAERNAFNGLALAIVRPRAGAGGAITLRVEADGLTSGAVVFQAR
ncbi:MAG: glycoside hydrolase family 2 protein [Opitutae bacterium]|nr:glycoside hydrolase family 2 protein [Opitutae bacterium]